MVARTLLFHVWKSLALSAVQGGKTLLVGVFFFAVLSLWRRAEQSLAVCVSVDLMSCSISLGMESREVGGAEA